MKNAASTVWAVVAAVAALAAGVLWLALNGLIAWVTQD